MIKARYSIKGVNMFCTQCGKKLEEPQDTCCNKVYIVRKDDVIVIVDQKTAFIMIVG